MGRGTGSQQDLPASFRVCCLSHQLTGQQRKFILEVLLWFPRADLQAVITQEDGHLWDLTATLLHHTSSPRAFKEPQHSSAQGQGQLQGKHGVGGGD